MHAMADTRPEPAKRLQAAREAAGYKSLKEAADRFGWVYDTYAQHENGTRGLARAAKQYARAYRVSEGWLTTGFGRGPGNDTPALETLEEIYRYLTPEERAEFLRTAETHRLASESRRRNPEGPQSPSGPADE